MSQCVALHSSQSHGGQWRSFAKLLPANLPFQSPDLIGYGTSGSFSSFRDVKQVRDFRFEHELTHLRQCGVDVNRGPFLVVGHSYGAALALKWARAFPHAVAGLVLYEPVAFHVLPQRNPARDEIVSVSEAMETMNHAQACAHFVDYWNSPGYFSRLPQAAQQLMIAQQPKVSADFHALLDEPADLNDYAALHVPTYLFSGAESPQSSQTVAALLAETLPVVEHKTLAAGHMGPITSPRVVLPAMAQALNELIRKPL